MNSGLRDYIANTIELSPQPLLHVGFFMHHNIFKLQQILEREKFACQSHLLTMQGIPALATADYLLLSPALLPAQLIFRARWGQTWFQGITAVALSPTFPSTHRLMVTTCQSPCYCSICAWCFHPAGSNPSNKRPQENMGHRTQGMLLGWATNKGM